jgi:hypothetical protein
MKGRYRHLVMYPPQLVGCPSEYPWLYYLPIGLLAARLGLTINSGIGGRYDREGAAAYCRALTAQLRDGKLDAATVYVVHDHQLELFAGAACTRLEGLNVCRSEASPACPLQGNEPAPPPFATRIKVSDPAAAKQLVSGFYTIEQDAWRWTAPRFSVRLAPPGAVLRVHLSLPERLISEGARVTVSARVGGVELSGETYTRPGRLVYARSIQASLVERPVQIEVALSPADAPARGLKILAIELETR